MPSLPSPFIQKGLNNTEHVTLIQVEVSQFPKPSQNTPDRI